MHLYAPIERTLSDVVRTSLDTPPSVSDVQHMRFCGVNYITGLCTYPVCNYAELLPIEIAYIQMGPTSCYAVMRFTHLSGMHLSGVNCIAISISRLRRIAACLGGMTDWLSYTTTTYLCSCRRSSTCARTWSWCICMKLSKDLCTASVVGISIYVTTLPVDLRTVDLFRLLSHVRYTVDLLSITSLLSLTLPLSS